MSEVQVASKTKQMMRLTRTIPERVETIRAHWCAPAWMENNETFRSIRAGSRSPMTCCYWCKRKFDDGEMISVASIESIGNKALCGKCANELMDSMGGE